MDIRKNNTHYIPLVVIAAFGAEVERIVSAPGTLLHAGHPIVLIGEQVIA